MNVTVLLLCYNEQEALPGVISGIRGALDGKPYAYDILLVDDGSTDQSAKTAESLLCRVISHGVRRGAGAAFKTGILSSQGSVIVILDADGTYTAADIPRMLAYFPEFDQVNGARTSEQGSLPFLRTPAKWFVRMFASLLAAQMIPDLQTGLKAFKKDIMLRYLWIIPDKFSYGVLTTLIFLCNRYAVKYIPTAYHRRAGGRSKFHPIIDTLYVLMKICQFFIYFYPLRIFLPMAILLALWGLSARIVPLMMGAMVLGLIGFVSDSVAVRRIHRP